MGVLADELRKVRPTQIGGGVHTPITTGIHDEWLCRFPSMITILIIILLLMLIGALPTWPHSSKWGYGPSGGLGTILVILLVLYLMKVI